MANKLTIDKAIKLLKERARGGSISVKKINNNDYLVTWKEFDYSAHYTSRKLIKFARCYTADINEPYMKDVKHLSSKKDRTALTAALNKDIETIEQIPSKRRIKVEDVWSWD